MKFVYLKSNREFALLPYYLWGGAEERNPPPFIYYGCGGGKKCKDDKMKHRGEVGTVENIMEG